MLGNNVVVSSVELRDCLERLYPSSWSSLLYRDFDTTKYGAVQASCEFLCELRSEVNVTVRFIGEGFEGVVADWWGVVGCLVEEGPRKEYGEEGRGKRGNV